MTVESKATRKLTIAPTENKGITPVYQNTFQGLTDDQVLFSSNPKNFNLDRAKKNPLFKGTVENYRQGDVLLARINKLPDGTEPMTTTVLAESFLTGNTHEFIYGDITIVGQPDGEFYVIVEGDFAILAHNESQTDRVAHRAHVVQPGIYHVKFQQTYFDNRPIRVID